jgi:glycosyltransferase involved in cell wall biosynthesis
VDRFLVAVDGTPLQDEVLGGVGRHLANTLRRLPPDVDLVLLTDARRPAPRTDLPCEPIRVPRRLPRLAWLELGAGPWLARHDAVFHGTFYAIPLRFRGPAVTAFHDVAWETHPEDQGRGAKRWAWRHYGRAAAARSASLITVSEFSRQQIVDVYDVDPASIYIAPNSVEPSFMQGASRVDVRAVGLHSPYVATLGGARRRGLSTAVAAWRAARQATGLDVDLAVVGSEAAPEEPGVHNVGRVDDDTWAAVLAGAQAFLYATRFEGFGVPALEAMHAGTAVVCAPVGSLPEVIGDAGAWAAEPTSESLGGALATVLVDDAWRASLAARGRDRAAHAPTWQDAADATLAAYRRAWESPAVPRRARRPAGRARPQRRPSPR